MQTILNNLSPILATQDQMFINALVLIVALISIIFYLLGLITFYQESFKYRNKADILYYENKKKERQKRKIQKQFKKTKEDIEDSTIYVEYNDHNNKTT